MLTLELNFIENKMHKMQVILITIPDVLGTTIHHGVCLLMNMQ